VDYHNGSSELWALAAQRDGSSALKIPGLERHHHIRDSLEGCISRVDIPPAAKFTTGNLQTYGLFNDREVERSILSQS